MAKNDLKLLSEIYSIVNRLEDKLDKRMCTIENKVDNLESFRDNILGKLAIVVAIVTVIGTLTVDWLRRKLNI